MTSNSAVLCHSAIECAYQFQTLASGLLAIVAGVTTAAVIWRSAKLPVEAAADRDKQQQEREIRFACAVLATNFQLVSARARQAIATIEVVVAANAIINDEIRNKVSLKIDPIMDNINLMSLLPLELINQLISFKRNIDDHNFDMARAGGAFGDENFRRSIKGRLSSIRDLALALSGQLHARSQGR